MRDALSSICFELALKEMQVYKRCKLNNVNE